MNIGLYCLGVIFSSIGHIGEVLIQSSMINDKPQKEKNRIGF